MINIKFVIVIIGLLVSTQAVTAPNKTFKSIVGGSTKDTAINFFEKYNQHLKRGMSLKNLPAYWSDVKVKEYLDVASHLSNVSGNSHAVDMQRMLDIEHSNAVCEKIELVDVKTKWKIRRKAKLTYTVNNICSQWKKPVKRVVAMEYIRKDQHWVIHSIINTEI